MTPTQIVIHHSASGKNTTLKQINAWHKARFNFKSSRDSYIGYHYVIKEEGQIYQPRRDNELGAHSTPNAGKIGICLIGNFMISAPTDAQLFALANLLNSLKRRYNIEKVLGHRDCNATECPGDNLYEYIELFTKINWLQRLIRKLLNFKFNATSI